jgi:hypothetical protein
MHTRLLLLAIPWALLGPDLPAQTTWLWQDYAHWNPVRTGDLPQNELARNLVVGNFTGHDHPDVAMLLGTKVALCSAPAIHNYAKRLMRTAVATGLATLQKGGSHGRDMLVVSTATALYGWSVDTGITTLDSGNWQSVCVGDLDGVAPDDFVGISNAGGANDRIRIVLREEGQTPVASTITFPGEVVGKIVLAQWEPTNSGELEICVMTDAQLWVGEPTGAIAQVPFANDGNGLMTRIDVLGTDRLAWLGTVSGAKILRTFRAGAATSQDATWIGAALDLSAGAWSNEQSDDGIDDLFVARASGTPLIVRSDAAKVDDTEPYTQVGAEFVTPFTGSVQPVNPVWPAAWLGDLNGDGYTDLFTVLRTTSTSGVHSTSFWPCRRIPSWETRTFMTGVVKISEDELLDETDYTIRMYPTLPVTDPLPTHMELLVYSGDDSTGVLQMNPAPFRRERVEYTGNGIMEIGWRMPTPSAPTAFMGAIRWIHVDNGVTTHAWPSTVFTVAVEGSIVPYEEWQAPRILECATPIGIVSPNAVNGYTLRRELGLSQDSVIYAFTGDEGGGTGDLPPPPPDSGPPKPPPPPPPPPPPGG